MVQVEHPNQEQLQGTPIQIKDQTVILAEKNIFTWSIPSRHEGKPHQGQVLLKGGEQTKMILEPGLEASCQSPRQVHTII